MGAGGPLNPCHAIRPRIGTRKGSQRYGKKTAHPRHWAQSGPHRFHRPHWRKSAPRRRRCPWRWYPQDWPRDATSPKCLTAEFSRSGQNSKPMHRAILAQCCAEGGCVRPVATTRTTAPVVAIARLATPNHTPPNLGPEHCPSQTAGKGRGPSSAAPLQEPKHDAELP